MSTLNKLILFTIVLLSSCSNLSRLDSDNFSSTDERVKILKQEIKCFSELEDAEFELFNVNGFKSQSQGFTIPGASSWDYKFAIKVDTADISKWTEDMVKFDPEQYDDNWTKQIVEKRKESWQVTCEPTYYMQEDENITIVEFRENGIIFKRVVSN